MRSILLIATIVCSWMAVPATAENWPCWRGPRGDGTSLERVVPTVWSGTKNIAWKTAAPGEGHSRAENNGISISVRDRGVGISERDRNHIIDKFYRVAGPISQTVKGAGIGLSLVKHIVAAHSGAVECESRVGEGSTFSIRLPAAPSAAGG